MLLHRALVRRTIQGAKLFQPIIWCGLTGGDVSGGPTALVNLSYLIESSPFSRKVHRRLSARPLGSLGERKNGPEQRSIWIGMKCRPASEMLYALL
jgi:hypothetical protein